MPLPHALLLVGALSFLIGLSWFLIGLSERAREKRHLRDGREATGRVAELVTFPNEDDLQSGQYRLVVAYEVNGIEYRVKSRDGCSAWESWRGRELPVIYDPRRPSTARLALDLAAGPPVWRHALMALVGVILVVVSGFV